MYPQNTALLSLAVLTCSCRSFLLRPSFPSFLTPSRSRTTAPLYSEKGPVPSVRSGRKELAYDEASGRFYEASDREECENPEDEFCAVDKATGKLIRLTLEEKERIFLDSLQVSNRADNFFMFSRSYSGITILCSLPLPPQPGRRTTPVVDSFSVMTNLTC
jgi:hypothetical protein